MSPYHAENQPHHQQNADAFMQLRRKSVIPAVIIAERDHPESKSKHTVDSKSKYPVQNLWILFRSAGGVTQLHQNVHFQINRKRKMNGKMGYYN